MPATIASQEGTVSEASDEKKYFLTVTYNKTIVINVKHKNMGTVNSIAQIYIDKIKADCETQRPLVAIHCITYNHERFLRDALEGFVSQQTDFPYVAIVHEDKSTDGTAAILREYAEKYPDIIKPIFEEENQYSKPDGSLGAVMNAALNATGAKYVAYCEGDDYWTSPEKLQKQFDFLETHPDYTMCCHNAIGHHVANDAEDKILGVDEDMDIPSITELGEKVLYSATQTFFVKNEILNSEYYNKIISTKHKAFGDNQIRIAALHYGKVRQFKDVMSVYNIHNGGAVAAINRNHSNYYYTLIELSKAAGKDYESVYRKYKIPSHFGTMLMAWDVYPDNIKAAWRMFRFAPLQIINHVSKAGIRFVANGFKFKR